MPYDSAAQQQQQQEQEQEEEYSLLAALWHKLQQEKQQQQKQRIALSHLAAHDEMGPAPSPSLSQLCLPSYDSLSSIVSLSRTPR